MTQKIKGIFPKFNEIRSQKAIDSGIGYLNPAEILNYILTKIIGDEPKHQKCVSCGNIKPDVYLRHNPYKVEINDDYTRHYLCNDCVANLAEEI